MSTERDLYLWQQVSGCCLTARKNPGKNWVVRVQGTCAITGLEVSDEGHGATVGEAITSLLCKMRELLENPGVQNLIKRLDNL